jgi:hypothetical protein
MTGASNKAKENGSEEKMPLGNFTSHSSKSFRPFVFIQVVSSVAQGVGGLSRFSNCFTGRALPMSVRREGGGAAVPAVAVSALSSSQW